MAKEIKLNINKFLGLWHDETGETNIPNGAFSQMQNFQILPNGKLRKRSGYTSLLDRNFFEYLGTTLTIPAGRMVGDVDGNGKFTQADLTLLTDNDHYLKSVNEASPIDLKACDINNDKQVTSSDLVIMMDLMSNPYTVGTWARDLLGVWGTKYDLEVTTTDWTYYTDITVSGMTEGDDIPIVLEGFDDIGLLPTAERGAGYIRVFSKLLPATDRTAYYSTTLLTASELTPASPIRGQWYGKLNGKYYHIVATGGKAHIIDDGVVIEIGELADAPTNIFQFGECVYFQDGTNYKRFTGIELVDEGEVNYDSTDVNDTYPKIMTLPAGKYRFQLGGGKGNPKPLNTGYDFGGRGGKINFSLKLDQQSTVEIRKITNQTGAMAEYGASFWVLVNGEICAAVGGGGGGSWFNGSAGGSYYNQRKGGDGGGDIGQDGTQGVTEDGKGANLCEGGKKGIITKPSSSYKVTSQYEGDDGYDCDHPDKAGQGGSGSYTANIGGCGYAGGGGGSSVDAEKRNDSSSWFSRNGAGGGGSSFVNTDDPNLILFENSRGTNNGSPYIKINTIREYLSLEDAGYAPLVYVGTKPDGTSGTELEPINNLSARRRQQFNGDDTATVFNLSEKKNYSVYEVYVDGELKRLTDEYTINANNDVVTFINKPPTGINNVEIRYMKEEFAEGTEEISKHTHARVYGGKNDSRVFLYGNGNRLVFSDLADGIPSAEYFPVFNTIDVGTSQHDITGLTVQYDRMLIHKEVGTWWTNYDYDANLLLANFPTYPLNDNVGCSYKGVEQVCENNPFVIQNKQLYQFLASNVRDERNVQYLSERVQPLLDQLDFEGVKTFDYERYGEYWIILGQRAYVFNYRMGVWFYYYFASEITSIALVEDKITLGTLDGDIVKLDGSLDDSGELINSFAETGWIDYGQSYIRKFLNFMWVQIFPESDTSVEIYYETDRSGVRNVKEISYKNLDFEDIDFADFGFETSYNPKSFRVKPKAKKFVYIKFTFVNEKRNRLALLGFSAPSLLGGMSK